MQFDTILLSTPLGVCVANIIPRPYLRACATRESALALQAVLAPEGAKICASSITYRRPVRLGLHLMKVNSDICKRLTKESRALSLARAARLITETRVFPLGPSKSVFGSRL